VTEDLTKIVEQAKTVEQPRPPIARKAPPPPQRAVVQRPAPRPAARTVSAPPEVVAPPVVATPATDTKTDKPDCTPPYYFDGSKKIFKPACL
jgi:hypothetical protein